MVLSKILYYISAFMLVMKLANVEAYDPLDPYGNITIKWDVMQWSPDGYVAVVTMINYQMYRGISSPGWNLGWVWAKKEVIWSMVGGQATEQGDCSKFKGTIPHSCKKDPTIVDLLPGAPMNQQFTNCCKGGVLNSWGQNPSGAVSAFQLSVGRAGTTNKTVSLPRNFTLRTPGPGYTCSNAKIVKPSVFLSPDGRRTTQALMTWNVTCTYSQLLASKSPSCCVSLSSFYNSTIVPCPTCSCGCQDNSNCIPNGSEMSTILAMNASTQNTVQCTNHMCPVRVHWHVKLNYREYWRAKISITNFDYLANYTQWTLVVQHPNLNQITQVFSFNYMPLTPYTSINDTGMFYGVKFFNDVLLQDGPDGNVQSEILLQKDLNMFTFQHGWAFPRKIYFNGDECVMPSPDVYPQMPNAARKNVIGFSILVVVLHLALMMISSQ